MDRRNFFKLSALASGGFMMTSHINAQTKPKGGFTPNPFIEISSSGEITLVAHVPEIGQGIKTALPMLIAEELEVDWTQVQIKTVVVDEKLYGRQAAGGSQSVAANYMRLRQLGAATKLTLLNAAAEKWGVPVDQCEAASGVVISKGNDTSATYGELAVNASKLKAPEPEVVKLKKPEDFKLLGTRVGGVDNEDIVQGNPLFGIDQVQSGMKYASYLRSPSFHGEVKNANLEKVKKMPGVMDAFILKSAPAPIGGLYAGVAIIADSTWSAFQAKDALKVEWDAPDASQHSSERYLELAEKAVENDKGKGGENSIEAFYHYPLLAHNTLEPQNCTAIYKNGQFEFWSPTQAPKPAIATISKIFKIKPNKIKINITRSGGGFGRRINCDFMVEVAAIAKQQEGTPIKLTWTREQDVQQDFYRNACWHLFQGSVDDAGNITSLLDHVVALGQNREKPGIGGKLNSKVFPFSFIKDQKIKQTTLETNIPFGWWRAPGSNGFGFAVQSFVDELAHKAGKDPVDFRMEILKGEGKGYNSQRMIGALAAATKKANWGKPLPKGSAQGVAFYFSHKGYVAVVAEVTVSKDGKLRVDKLTAGVDVGPIVNLSGAENQVEGSMLDGLSSALYQEIKLKDGVVQNSNFHDVPVLRMAEVGEVEVEFVKSDAPATGLGEPALPPAIPAVCNAIFTACGKRIRTLPISQHDLSWT